MVYSYYIKVGRVAAAGGVVDLDLVLSSDINIRQFKSDKGTSDRVLYFIK